MEKQIIKDYNENFLTFLELSKKYHLGQTTIRNILYKNNIYIRSAAETDIMKKNKDKHMTFSQIEKKIIHNYAQLGMGQLASGKEFQISGNTVKKILQKNNIAIRNLHEARQLSNNINPQNIIYSKDEFFFGKESRNMAWLLGFLAADGNVSKRDNRIRIELSYVDEEILQRIKQTVKIENPIYYRESSTGRKFVGLNWNCKQHKRDLSKYSIVPNKTYILSPPYNLSQKYQLDYIRGYFDGDGTININMCNKGKSKAIRFGICGASKPVLDWIVDVFEAYGIPRVKPHLDTSHENDFWNIIYSSKSSRKIYQLLYNNIDNSILFLKRKKEKYEKILQEVPEKLNSQEAP